MADTIWNECKSCKRETKHNILKSHKREGNPEIYHYAIIKMMVQCLGCERVSFREEDHDYESYRQIGPDEWEHDEKIEVYPHFISNHNDIDNIEYVPNIVSNIYHESILAISEGAFTLAGLGLRATIEAICNEQNISGKNLQVRINRMHTQGLISKKDANRLHAIRFLGNDAAHEIKKAKKGSVLVALKIIEHIILTVYILDKEVKTHLETTISSFDDLIKILEEKMAQFSDGEIVTFTKWMGKDKRRITENYQTFENELINYINGENFDNVEIANIPDTESQGYKISKNVEQEDEIDDFDISDFEL